METNQIIENNRLIAEFMDFKKVRSSNKIKDYYLPRELWFYVDGINDSKPFDYDTDTELIKECYPEQMRFSTSWDWLMPVVEKIESLDLDKILPSYGNIILRTYSKYYSRFESINSQSLHFPDVYGKTKILSIYNAVVEFIKWFDKNK